MGKSPYPSCNVDSDYFTRISELNGDRIINGDNAFYLDSENSIVKLNLVDYTSSKLTKNRAERIVLDNDFIYYLNTSEETGDVIYKVRTDGADETKVYEGDINSLKENDGEIYFIDGEGILNRLNESGTGVREINNGSITSVTYFTEDYIICKAYKWNLGGGLYRISKDTEDTEMIVSDMPSGFSYSSDSGILTYYYSPLERVIDDWIYYVNEEDGSSLYKVKVDGTNRTRLNSFDSTIIDIIGDWLYYHNNSDMSKVYRVKIDGSENSKVQG